MRHATKSVLGLVFAVLHTGVGAGSGQAELDLEIFELQEFLPGWQNRKEWLRRLDSNLQPLG